jgi:rhodanese-related sulfurtransferase
MGKSLIVLIVIIVLWDVLWWILGVAPLFPWQLRKRLGDGTSPPLLLDVRTPLEYNWLHLPSAQNRPDLLLDKSTIPPVAPTQDVVVICMTGHRSPFVSLALKKQGFSRVYNLTWGMLGWKIYEWLTKLSVRPEPPKDQKF